MTLPLAPAGFSFGEDPKEMAELARKYEHGVGCPRDIGKALLYYKRAAEANEPSAMVALGDLYREGKCVPQDMGYARGMYDRAAKLGFAPAMARMGDTSGGSVAEEWFRQAAGKGYGPAMTRLGDLLRDASWYQKATEAGDPPAFAKLAAQEKGERAEALVRRGAELKDPVAMRLEGIRTGSTELLLAAAEAGDAEAMEHYARRCDADGKAGDALAWYTKAAEAGRVRAKYWLGKRGHGPIYPDLVNSAASAGDPDALFETGNIEAAANAGHPEALAQLGRVEEAAKRGHAASLFKIGRIEEAAQAGHAEAMYRVGSKVADRGEAMQWIKRSAEAGYVPAMRELAVAYESGAGIQKDTALGGQWMKKAADGGDAEALFRTGDMKGAAAAGHRRAMYRVGLLPAEQAAAEGIAEAKAELAKRAKSPREAYKMYVEAANAGSTAAMIAVGDCHLEARGTWRSEVDAVNWYRKAALAGDPEGLKRLQKLGKGL
jgi:TPR repeat protein